MKPIRLISAAFLFVAASGPGFAADPVFPPGVRVGLTPLVGLAPAKAFTGFETEDQSVKVLVAELNGGQLRMLLRATHLIDAQGLNKVQGKPFLVSEIEQKVEEMLRA